MGWSCHGPSWPLDDFSKCVQQKYFHIIFPSILITISALWFISRLIGAWGRKRRSRRHTFRDISYRDSTIDHPSRQYSDSTEDDSLSISSSSASDTITIGLGKSDKDTITVVESKPAGAFISFLLETTAVMVQLGTSIALIILRHPATPSEGTPAAHEYMGYLVSAIVWAYLLAVLTLRIVLSSDNVMSLRLWYNSIICYGVLWIFHIFTFRSSLIHPIDNQVSAFVAVQFIASSLIFGILITQRKGNRPVYLELEGDLEPSKEQTASLLSLATFSWVDPLIMKGYMKPLNMSDVWTLLPRDKARHVLDDYRQFKKTGILAYHLIKHFKFALFIQACWAAFFGLLIFMPTLLLQAIIRYVEDPDSTPRNAAWFYISLFFVSAFLGVLADGQALWIGRKLGVHLKAIIVGEIYAKSLRRRAAAAVSHGTLGADPASVLDSSTSTTLAEATQSTNQDTRTIWQWLFPCFGQRRRIMLPDPEADADTNSEQRPDSPAKVATPDNDETASSGAIINLMSTDATKVSTACSYLHIVIASAPVQIVTSVALLYRVLGSSAIAGIILMLIILPVNLLLAKKFVIIQKLISAATDRRIDSTNEVLENIRIIKYFAWETKFINQIEGKRSDELIGLKRKYLLWSMSAAIWSGTPLFITFFSFFCYTIIEGKALIPSVAFTAVSLFQILRIPLDQLADMITHVQESKVSVDRVEEFLNQAETNKYDQIREEGFAADGTPLVGFKDATFTWACDDQQIDIPDDSASGSPDASFKLFNLDVRFRYGGLNVIIGPTGSGKSSILMALLGEMSKLNGNIYLPGGGRGREDCRIDPETGLAHTVAYCAQQPWLVNNTIRQNILFGQRFDAGRYNRVVDACSLSRDFEILKDGDQTLVGEKGVSLSGGQKARISLARALFSSSRLLLLDDVFSAVDSHTAKWIFEKAILGPLLYDRTCILVTHNTALCLPAADFGIVLENGRILAQGDFESLKTSGQLSDDVSKSTTVSRISSRLSSWVSPEANGDVNSAMVSHHTGPTKTDDELMGDESSEIGSVKLSVMTFYAKEMGGWLFWLFASILFLGQQAISVTINVWIRRFANSYTRTSTVDPVFTLDVSHSLTSNYPPIFQRAGPVCFRPLSAISLVDPRASGSLSVSDDGSSTVRPMYYLVVYAMMGLVFMLFTVLREFYVFQGSVHASRSIHRKLVTTVARAKFRFFDATPLGQIMNRFSKDMETIDHELSATAIGLVYCVVGLLTVVGMITFVLPWFLLAAMVISVLYLIMAAVYINSSRDLKRMESVQRSPLFQHFGETLSGVTTIRAYGEEQRFVRDNLAKIDTSNRPYINLWAANRWLSVRVDLVGALVSFCTGVFIILSVGQIDAGAAALAMAYALTFTDNVLWAVRLYAANEQNMNSLERVKEYLDVEEEAPAEIENNRPTTEWPAHGSVEFLNYSTRYAEGLEPVLRNLSMKIEPGEKVGIVGRTGAGKSSLALALFRALEATEGKIVVDSIDIATIGLKDLRGRIVMVPQDPTLFTGTIRTNLDPFDQITDDHVIFQALLDVQLIDAMPSPRLDRPALASSTVSVASDPSSSDQAENQNVFYNLDSPIAESGSNLSQGQRQLLCLARAMLRRPKILLMDEATASIDYATDAKIQKTLRKMRNTTITIAHRLQTIIDYDKIIVLDRGTLLECAHPWELLELDQGTFRGMCESSGDIESLRADAESAWKKKRESESLLE